MSLHFLNDKITFPPAEEANEEGLLAIGGDLSPERLLEAYRNGIFPWFSEEDPILWWSPDPRFVLFPSELKVSKSMGSLIRKQAYQFTTNQAFETVIDNCKTISRNGQDSTWITQEIKEAYIRLHQLGYAHSAEAWQDGALAGGLYGVRIGNLFFGESMFSKQSNASKFAFIQYMQQLQQEGVFLVDCQVYTEHLESLGAKMIPRSAFLAYLVRQHL